ncbi:MAG: glycine--tRNA ligase subunit beta [Elusimicrobiota bacterium]
MKTAPFLIEVGCEDLPPEMICTIEEQAADNLSKILRNRRISCKGLKALVSHRRIAVKIDETASHQETVIEKVKGPPVAVAFKDGKPTPAGLGFAKKLGANFSDLQIEETPRGKYYYCQKNSPGKPLKELIEDITIEFLSSFSFSITMRWPGGGLCFPRPIRWILVKYGKSSFDFSLGALKSSKTSRGHRVFSNKCLAIEDIKDYEKVLKQNYVLVDASERKKYLKKAIDRPLSHSAGSAIKDEFLLEEVSSSLEFPTGIKGEFPAKYLDMPREVIEACLMYHQKYFPVESDDGDLMNCFVGVRDGISEHIDPIRRGYERVLIARLEDAEFFLKQDRQHPLEYYSKQLAGIEFTRGLGTLADKTMRCKALASFVAKILKKDNNYISTVRRIADLGKADLVTHMVGEFPELEGKIGRIYAAMDGESKKVSEGIYQHYMPRTFEDKVPGSGEAAIVGVADRVDTLVGNYGAGVEATGSQDPFGMRRACRGLIRIMVEKKWDLDLKNIVFQCRREYGSKTKIDFTDETMVKLEEFLGLQIKNYLEESFPHDIARCVMASGRLNPYTLSARASAVEKIKKSKGFDSLITAFRRINNIIKQAEENGVDIPPTYEEAMLEEGSEQDLNSIFSRVKKDAYRKISAHEYAAVLKLLASMRAAVDMFFNDVLVMDPDKGIMKNRLAMLRAIVELFAPVGDISKLETK